MQREIKFRAWWKDAELMEEVVSFSEDKVTILVPLKPNSLGQKYERQTLEEGQYELMQFTGLKDKNGHPIWEGDFVQEHHTIYEVEFRDGAFRYKGHGAVEGHIINSLVIEVTGNMYENERSAK